MKIKESSFWTYLKKYFDKHKVLYDRIEPTVPGTPDVNAIHNGKEIWIELKSEDGYKIGIKPWQIRWAKRRARAGSHVYLLIKRKTAKVDQIEVMYMCPDTNKYQLIGIYPKQGTAYPIKEIIKEIFNGA